eukprot:GHVT01030049.1.p1 GENE.GHVT01030049.1~~GHVT01030049.1.p1  ORF type:complete len:125 (-),score=23.69 GHVT01030049.1:112-486(-)
MIDFSVGSLAAVVSAYYNYVVAVLVVLTLLSFPIEWSLNFAAAWVRRKGAERRKAKEEKADGHNNKEEQREEREKERREKKQTKTLPSWVGAFQRDTEAIARARKNLESQIDQEEKEKKKQVPT